MANDFKVLDEEKLNKVEKICSNLKEKQLLFKSSKYYDGALVYILRIKYGYDEIITEAFKKNGFDVRKWGDNDFCVDVSKPKPLDEVVEECFNI